MSITITSQVGKTYKFNYQKDKINGFTDRERALEQSIYCLLNTERYKYPIYSWNYGIQREDLFGKNKDLAMIKLQDRITNAISTDDRVVSVTDFVFDSSENGVLKVRFTVNSIYGELKINYEFNL